MPDININITEDEELSLSVDDDESIDLYVDYSAPPYDDTELRGRISTIEGKEAGWDSKAPGTHTHVVSDITNLPAVPTKTSDLTNDSGFITSESDPTVPSWAKATTKPTYTASEVGALPDTTIVPSKTSDLTNDSGFITSESDPTVPSWAKSPTKPTYTAAEVHALPDTTVFPTKTSDLTNDSGFITSESDPTVPSWAKQANKPSYTASEVGALPNTTVIPTKTSDLTNDSGFIASETDPTVPSWAKAQTKPSYTAAEVHALPDTTVIPTVPTSDINANTAARHSHSNKTVLDGISSDKVSAWDNKSDFSGNYNDLTNRPTIPSAVTDSTVSGWGYIKGYTETDPTVPDWAKAAQKPTYTAAEVGALPSSTVIPTQKFFVIHEDDCTVTRDEATGTSPYSTSYKYTNVVISADAGVEWVEGAYYTFVCNTSLVVASAYRNVRLKIGDEATWHPLMGYTSSIVAGSSYLIKGMTAVWQYKSTYQTIGALHLNYDANTTYSYLVNTVAAANMRVDANGYGARYSIAFPTTPTLANETYSSLVKSSSTGTKAAPTCTFYADRGYQYICSANIAAGGTSANATYQKYTGIDLRYCANVNSTYLTVNKKVFLWLKEFNTEDYSFKAGAETGNIMSSDKIASKFPSTVTGDVYLYWLGWNNTTYYSLTPTFGQDVIFKYTPSTGALEVFRPKSVTDDHINDLIDARIPEIEIATDDEAREYLGV